MSDKSLWMQTESEYFINFDLSHALNGIYFIRWYYIRVSGIFRNILRRRDYTEKQNFPCLNYRASHIRNKVKENVNIIIVALISLKWIGERERRHR